MIIISDVNFLLERVTEELAFADEAFDVTGIRRTTLIQDLERDLAFHRELDGPVDGAHTATAKFAKDPIALHHAHRRSGDRNRSRGRC